MIRVVHPDDVPAAWPLAAPYIRAAMEGTVGVDAEFLRAQAEDDLAQLWLLDGRAAAITRVHNQQGRVLEVVALGGEGMDAWLDEMVSAWRGFAQKTACKRIIATGRTGWRKAFKAHGFKVEKITGILEVQNA